MALGWRVVIGIVGMSSLRMVADGHEWRWMDADERRWDVNGRRWSGWVWMDADGGAGDYQIECKGKKILT